MAGPYIQPGNRHKATSTKKPYFAFPFPFRPLTQDTSAWPPAKMPKTVHSPVISVGRLVAGAPHFAVNKKAVNIRRQTPAPKSSFCSRHESPLPLPFGRCGGFTD